MPLDPSQYVKIDPDKHYENIWNYSVVTGAKLKFILSICPEDVGAMLLLYTKETSRPLTRNQDLPIA